MKTTKTLKKLFDIEIEDRINEFKTYGIPSTPKKVERLSRTIYNRLDEAMLIYSRLFNMTFYDVCEQFGINYDGFVELILNRKRNLLALQQWLL